MMHLFVLAIGLGLAGCGRFDEKIAGLDALVPTEAAAPRADVIGVEAFERGSGFTFSVTVSSPDTGCEQYADWWEVLDSDGALLYRRVLLHSHVTEQPFTRTGGPVTIEPDQQVWIRAHMNSGGYGGTAYTGSVQDGFVAANLAADFAAGVEAQGPLPQGCDF